MKLVWSIFAVVGGAFLVTALVLLAFDRHYFADAHRVPGEVVALRCRLRDNCAPDIAYTDHTGRPQVLRSDRYSRPSYQVGDRVTIAYHTPDDATIDGFAHRFLFPLVFGGLGSLQLTIGLIGLLRRRRRKHDIAWLLRQGERVDATVASIAQDTSVRVNHQHPWVIHCEAKLPGDAAPRTFTSRRFWYDPTPHIGRTLVVRYDPRDPARHLVDTGDLPTREEPRRQS